MGTGASLKKTTILDIEHAVFQAKMKHPEFPKDLRHQALILAEEAGEVAQAVLNHTDHGADSEHINKEYLHTIAVCVRALER